MKEDKDHHVLNELLTEMKPCYPTWWILGKDVEIDGYLWKAGKYELHSKGGKLFFTPLNEIDFS